MATKNESFQNFSWLRIIKINLKNIDKQPAQAHEVLPDVFTEWQEIESPWDKERLIFETIYEIIGQ